MPLGVMSWVGRDMGVLDGVIVEGKGSFGGKCIVGRPIITNGDGEWLFPNYFGEDLLVHV